MDSKWLPKAPFTFITARKRSLFAKVMFLHLSVILLTGGEACMVLFGGGCVVLFGGACVVLFGRACVVLFGGMRGFIQGACMVLFRGHAWFYSGAHACVVLFGGHAWFYLGGHAWFFRGGMHGFFSFFGYNEIRSMSGRYASYWNAFLFKFVVFQTSGVFQCLVLTTVFGSTTMYMCRT